MKKKIEFAIIFTLIMAGLYLITSFIVLDVNFANWQQHTRAFYGILGSVISLLLTFLITSK